MLLLSLMLKDTVGAVLLVSVKHKGRMDRQDCSLEAILSLARKSGNAESLLFCFSCSPGQTPRLILCHAHLEEILLFAQIHNLAHPGEGILGAIDWFKVDALEAAIRDIFEIGTNDIRVHAKNAAWQAIFGIGAL